MTDRTVSLAASSGPPAPPPAPESPTTSSWGPAPTPREGAHPARIVGYAIAVSPLIFALVLTLIAPGFLRPLFDDRVSLIGLPAGTFLIAAVLLLVTLGILAVRFVREIVLVALVLFVTTSIGMMLVLFGPASVLIMINLKT